MNSKLVSIIVVSYNNLKYFKECLDSIFMQDYESIELIFSDDSSKDFRREEIEKYILANKKSNITNYIISHNDENLGTVKNLNKAIKLSKGDYIKPIAVDDTLYQNKTISKLVDCLEKAKALMCFGYIDVYDELMKTRMYQLPTKEWTERIRKAELIELYEMLYMSSTWFFPAPSRMYSRECFERYGLHNEKYLLLEDKSLLAKVIKEGGSVHFLDEVVANYRLGGVSTCEKKSYNLENDLNRFAEDEILPYLGISLKNSEKKLIVWGLGVEYFENRYKLLEKGFKYFVDSDINKEGQEVDGKKIYPPQKLLSENKDNIMVVVCSGARIDISHWLKKHGFKIKKNYIYSSFLEELS